MFSKSANKIGKRKGGILHVFNKTIKDLQNLSSQTEKEIKKRIEKIKVEEAEKKALQDEQMSIQKITMNMRTAIGLDEPVKKTEPIPPTEN